MVRVCAVNCKHILYMYVVGKVKLSTCAGLAIDPAVEQVPLLDYTLYSVCMLPL